ncbi:Hpt domain-containing protein [Sansalvadorimonas sp. 2012CJ34-2]|uniref:histidine kinase n=1 Tax=Parendozoicomonas callyspongiae TaxID=2942213 RepID=A0ABT0PB37_9GAMM|nr:Hpt domain-containing protein [Sansalvadorimonas sp. 2012CJ34-2]MCL6268446.1 Hpt domain-containing protein [Sansalvadorimonas sp. 2012CJ34-2]
MEDRRSISSHHWVALGWVRTEISNTLLQARQCLEAYAGARASNGEDSSHLKFCQTYVHQVRAVLEMVEFCSPVVLAEEMELLVEDLVTGRVPARSDAFEALVRSLLELPNWLEQMQARHDDSLVGILPILNDLRSARGEPLYSETSVFNPSLDALTPVVSDQELARLQGKSLVLLLKKLRQMYQFALVGFFNHPGDKTHQNYLLRVFERMASLCNGMPAADLWPVAEVLVKAVQAGDVRSGPAVRNLLRRVDKVLAEQADNLSQSFNWPAPAELLQNCLYYAACCQSDDQLTRTVQEKYKLADAFPERKESSEESSGNPVAVENLQSAEQAVLAEAYSGLKHAREAIADFISSDFNRECIFQVPEILLPVHGSLDIIGQERIAELVKAARHFIEVELLHSHQPPGRGDMNSFAEVLAGAEYIVECLKEDRLDLEDETLQRAEESLKRLGAFEREIQNVPSLDEQVIHELTKGQEVELAAPGQSYDEIDQEFIEIFSEEAEEVREQLQENLSIWRNDLNDAGSLKVLRRGFHTLKGSGRMAGAGVIGDLSWSVENMLNQVVEDRIKPHSAMLKVVDSAVALLPELLVEYTSHNQRVSDVTRACIGAAEALSQGNIPTLQPVKELEKEEEQSEPSLDPELAEIFRIEAFTHLQVIDDFASDFSLSESSLPVSDDLLRSLHTLKGSASMAGITPVMDISTGLEFMTRELRARNIEVDEEIIGLIMQGSSLIQLSLEQLDSSPFQRIEGTDELLAEIRKLSELRTGDYEEFGDGYGSENLFRGENLNTILDAINMLSRWKRDPSDKHLTHLCDGLLTLAGNARQFEQDAIAELAEELAVVYQVIQTRSYKATDGDLNILLEAHDWVINMLDQLAGQETPAASEDILMNLQSLIENVDFEPDQNVQMAGLDDENSSELLAVFLDEAMDNLDAASAALYRWLEDSSDATALSELQRYLHTIKGGARMAGIKAIGDLGHELEGVYEALKLRRLKVTQDLINLLMSSHDTLEGMLSTIRSNNECKPAKKLCKSIRKVMKNIEEPHAASEAIPEELAEEFKVETVKVEKDQPDFISKPEVFGADGESRIPAPAKVYLRKDIEAANDSVSDEQVRVSAELLDNLVNLSAETSISRSRIEQQINDFSYTLKEMHTTIDRLQEQLRRLDTETHAQIISRHEGDGFTIRNFDPLEMDRYSELTQLSRSLVESATDLQDLKQVLEEKSRDSETLLLQQSRINSDLQEGLLRTRMLPFERMVPRLHRVVRQVSDELGKKVELKVVNAEGEMDRSVMERMIAPLEHMLRNAIDHGIEASAEERLAHGKKEVAEISLNLARDGGEIVLSLADDGKGLDLDAVRSRAVERGLLAETSKVSDHDISRMILQSGFTTASSVTQISGRGVGMDVVQNELKQLGGRIDIHSTLGEGTEFEIRLPFTLAVNRALMVNLADERYAIPLNALDGVVRLSPFELEGHYQDGDEGIEYAGRKYRLQYLGELLHEHKPRLDSLIHELPVLLMRFGEKNLAIQVDSLEGSREIVVKSLGPQFSGLRGVSGATILGDGRVVVILDMAALISDYATKEHTGASVANTSAQEEENNLIMVVDDSVTVRKVTTRLLKRNGYRTASARDGVEAMALLQDFRPAAILLDIEMPRMDGYEVAMAVRNDPELKDIPIIMVTSRTGEKHRQRAQEIGVNNYLGKPFQEAMLLETIGCFVKRHD